MGADLFAFDNYDPKGGCVLLNDGIVKFIRTEEELLSFDFAQHMGADEFDGAIPSKAGFINI